MTRADIYKELYMILRNSVVDTIASLQETLEEIDEMLGSENILEIQFELQKRKEFSTYTQQVVDDLFPPVILDGETDD